ncbi:MAG: hypothetical protein CL610_14080 [Anaerolineaceae bacterium]|nr:hypothetical protein [Anaerolineaceae bacterium]
MNPRLIRANIALFQGKRSETRRLLQEYVSEQDDPQTAQRSPMLLWLDAQARARHSERIDGLRTVVDNAPPDSPYHRMAKIYLDDEAKYQDLLDGDQQRPGVRRWAMIGGGLVALVALVAVIIVVGQMTGAPAVVDEVTEEPVIPTATVIVQNTPNPATLSDGALPRAEFIRSGGTITVRGIDPAVRVVVDERGTAQQPLEGATFYGLLLEFQCLLPICNNVPESEIYVRLGIDESGVRATDGLFVAGEQVLSGRAAQGQTVQGWVVFEVPRNNLPDALVVWPFAPTGSEERPDEIVVNLP